MSERGEYRAIYVVLIDSPEYLKLKPGARLTLFTLKLRLGPSGIGVIPALLANLSEATGMSAVQVGDALSELEGGDWIRTESNIVWIVNGLKYEPSISSKNINHRASVLTYLNSLPRLKIVDDFRRYYAEWLQIDPPLEDQPSPAPELPVPANGNKKKKPRPVPSSWVADGAAWWTENVGAINHGRFGTALKLLVDRFGWERTFAALKAYAENERGKQIRIEWFAANGVRLVGATTPPAKGPPPPGAQEIVGQYLSTLEEGEAEAWWKKMIEEAAKAGLPPVIHATQVLRQAQQEA